MRGLAQPSLTEDKDVFKHSRRMDQIKRSA
jgi:hypothetical protein